jgi:serine/threonine-protein kinase
MAMVFLGYATDGRAANPLVAIKRPHRHLAMDKTFLSMLLDEARLASLIDHPNVVKVRELGFHSGEPFIVMDYVEGASLSELRKELSTAGRAMDARMALRVVLDALAGLHAAHELRGDDGKLVGIIHRDVSPHNVLVGSDGRSRLTDFGIAKAADRVQTTRTHEVKGKLAYLAPERVDRRRMCTRQSDVFSMAVVLWECIAGRRLFRGDEAIDTLHEVMNAKIPRLRQLGARIPEALDEVIAHGLSRDLAVRFQTAADFAAALGRAAGRANIGTPEDVERTIETIFGARLASRHEQIRAAIADEDALKRVFEATGLAPRPPPSPPADPPDLEILASIAPPAPSGRYTFGKEPAEDYERARSKKARYGVVSGVVGGILVGAIITLAIVSRARAPDRARAPQPSAGPEPVLAATTRRVVIPLPFVGSRVALDDMERELVPAADVATFDVPAESGMRHLLVVTALDGTRAEGYVREQDGIARAEPDGGIVWAQAGSPLVSTSSTAATVSTGQALGKPRAPKGTMRNGFTKLR